MPSLPANQASLFFLLVRNGTVAAGTGIAPFTADVGIVANRVVRDIDGTRQTRLVARIDDLGDLHTQGALESVDATGLVVAPLWDPAMKAGDVVELEVERIGVLRTRIARRE